MKLVGGPFESDEFAPNIPQLKRPFKGPRFNSRETQRKDPFAKNPGVNAAISDPPPDLRLKPPMRGEVDKNDMGRSKQNKGQTYLPSWAKPKGDIMKSRGANY